MAIGSLLVTQIQPVLAQNGSVSAAKLVSFYHGEIRRRCVLSCLPDRGSTADNINLNQHGTNEPANIYTDGSGVVEAAFSAARAAQIQREESPTSTIIEDSPISSDEGLANGSHENVTDVEVASFAEQSTLEQIRQIFMFAGPALGVWLSGPIMGLIDTSVIGTTSSLELAALGPATILCDGLGYIFMFLAVATSNFIATALAQKDKELAKQHLARLFFLSYVCGVGVFVVVELFSASLLRAFVGSNTDLISAGMSYVKIRAWAWPIAFATMVAQSASLGMQDSWSPLKVLAAACIINAGGDILLCTFMGYGIAGAAWATTASQYVAGILMLKILKDKGYDPFALAIPSAKDLSSMIEIAAPVLLTMLSKVCFYTSLTFLAASRGAVTLAAHQVMINLYTLFSVVGEPLAQTSQSFMPSLLYGKSQNLQKAQTMLKTLLVVAAGIGISLATVSLIVPFFLPNLFTNDAAIIEQMQAIAFPFFCGTLLIPPTLTLEGSLLAIRDMKFLGISMAACLACAAVVLSVSAKCGLGLRGNWWTLVFFQMTRYALSFARLSRSSLKLKEAFF